MDVGIKSVLDVGQGYVYGSPTWELRKRRRFSGVGVDIWAGAIRMSMPYGLYDGYVVCDARSLPFRDRSFDAVLCFEVLEHMTKENGLRMLREFDKVARRQVLLTTPNGFVEQRALAGNIHQIHLSGWSARELSALGFKVRGRGLKPFYDRGLRLQGMKVTGVKKALMYLWYAISYLYQPLVYLKPSLAWDLTAIKKVIHRE